MSTKLFYMRTWLTKLLVISITSVLLFSCKKDEIKTLLKAGVAPSLTANPTTPLVLTSGNANNNAITFSWSASDYGYDAAVKYTLQIAKNGTNFATPREVNMGATLTTSYIVSDF